MNTSAKPHNLALIALSLAASSVQADGIPEPGLVMYGNVTNTAGNFSLMSGGVQWSASGAGSSVMVTSTIVNVNGQYFYIAQVPFETRAITPLCSVAAAVSPLHQDSGELESAHVDCHKAGETNVNRTHSPTVLSA